TTSQLIGLATLHSIGIVHRDFKPENLFIDWNGVVKVGDFGCGVITRGYKPLCGDEYAYEGLAGTWPYIAPEQFDDIYGLNYGISTDYWAFGLVLLEV
ncbi:kinase-like domain-containing protein, partial [Panaeolus papilionaceus]